jgi:hypothetical protein
MNHSVLNNGDLSMNGKSFTFNSGFEVKSGAKFYATTTQAYGKSNDPRFKKTFWRPS